MRESISYLRAAYRAVQCELDRDYEQAARYWKLAQQRARRTANAHWSQCRAEFCLSRFAWGCTTNV